jgi:hypothetical protein
MPSRAQMRAQQARFYRPPAAPVPRPVEQKPKPAPTPSPAAQGAGNDAEGGAEGFTRSAINAAANGDNAEASAELYAVYQPRKVKVRSIRWGWEREQTLAFILNE